MMVFAGRIFFAFACNQGSHVDSCGDTFSKASEMASSPQMRAGISALVMVLEVFDRDCYVHWKEARLIAAESHRIVV